MPNVTENYGLKKPLSEEFYDVNIQNENMDIIDAELKKRATLDESGKVPEEQLPDTTFIPVTSEIPSNSDIWIDPDDEAQTITLESIGAAPAGYGLGGACVVINHWDNANRNGYYTSNGGTPDGYWWWGEVYTYSEQAFVQHLVRLNDDNSLVHAWRTYSYGTFTPWEWVNPPMIPGAEYRTTERYNGKPVYVKLINFGALPNASHKDVLFYANDTSRPISVAGQCGADYNSLNMSIPSSSNGIDIFAVNYAQIRAITSHDASGHYARALVKYWKTTD